MSAVDEYRKYRDMMRKRGYSMNDCAARAIAELEAELERLDSFDVGLDAALAKLEAENRLLNEARENANAATFRVEDELAQERKAHAHDEKRATHHYAELAALKGRRCADCDSREGQSHYCLLLSINTGDAFYCDFWTARAEEETTENTYAGQCWGGTDTPDERARAEEGGES